MTTRRDFITTAVVAGAAGAAILAQTEGTAQAQGAKPAVAGPGQMPRGLTLLAMVQPDGAETLGVKLPAGILDVVKASAETEIDAAFAALSRLQVGAVIISTDPFFDSRREQLIRLATHHAVPAISESREFAAAGGLISYGPSFTAAYRQAGIYTGKILKGAKPADLPVEQPTTFELVVNLRRPRRSA